jgi:hypothetical protein
MEESSTSKPLWGKRTLLRYAAVLYLHANFIVLTVAAAGQMTAGSAAQPGESVSTYGGAGQSGGNQSNAASGAGLFAQTPYSGSVPEGKATPEVLQLSFKDALERGLRNNLGLLLQSAWSHRGCRFHPHGWLLGAQTRQRQQDRTH